MKSTISELTPLADRYGVSISLENSADTATVLMDYDLLPGVFTHVIKNAVEHVSKCSAIDEKTVAVRITNGENTVLVTVNNRGALIPKSHIKTFFQKFKTNRGRNKIGVGLGTTYALIVTEAHGGTMSVESKPSAGTTVSIRLPIGHS